MSAECDLQAVDFHLSRVLSGGLETVRTWDGTITAIAQRIDWSQVAHLTYAKLRLKNGSPQLAAKLAELGRLGLIKRALDLNLAGNELAEGFRIQNNIVDEELHELAQALTGRQLVAAKALAS